MEIEKYLILNKYFLNFFGFNEFSGLREKLKDTEEGYDSNGRSYFIDVLIGLKRESETELLQYDEAIREYVERLKKNRGQLNFNLKYFQYLAVLFTEMFLDRYYTERSDFLNDLNEFLNSFNKEKSTTVSSFTEDDLKKLAFWMATGSGKTLIMHINYWQILKYSKNDWDNIILITPNEGLSQQHYEELKLSGIPCRLYDGNIDNLKTRDGEILIIDIYKLTEEKEGEGVSVDVSYFDGRNLVFIDEGHKGQKSEERKWKKLRDEIGKKGFIFEYSATFGQVIGTDKELLEEYAKAIIIDYSYKYFYEDSYGKDFYIYNIKEDANTEDAKNTYSEEKERLLLTAGLLSFYEQLNIFEKNKEELTEYNIEKPLWIFVGSKVSGKGINSDIVKIILFLDKILQDEKYLKDNIQKILEGRSELIDNEGNDLFKGKFESIRDYDVNTLVDDIYKKIFGSKGTLKLYEIENAKGEIGLKTSEKYFGVINIGDINALKKLLTKIEIGEDHFNQSLFYSLNETKSSINILIGSKKFLEGWNSWRVSNMCLINMGKSEGPQIIQLFGRGVRLKGKNFSLKREENPNYNLKVLQTLSIIGLNADYIDAFLTTINREEVDYKDVEIPIKFNQLDKWNKKIYTIKTSDDFNFLNFSISLDVDEDILNDIRFDLRPKITTTHGLNVEIVKSAVDEPLVIPSEYLDFIDWNYIYQEIMDYKIAKNMYNMIINLDKIKNIVKTGKYKIFLNETTEMGIENKNGKPVLKIYSFKGIREFNEIVLGVIKDYILKFYKKKEKIQNTEHLEAEPLTDENTSMFPANNKIILKIPENLPEELHAVKEQIEEWKNCNIPKEWTQWNYFIISLDNHLYTPLIIWNRNEEIKSIPVKLNKGETKFIKDFKDFLERNKDLFKNMDVFLLRNLSRKGIGFFINAGFYPDFVIWINKKDKQHMIFIDPKGIRNLGNFNDDKIQLCDSYIKEEIEVKVNENLKKDDKLKLQLDAFILSITPFNIIKNTFDKGNNKKEDFEDHHILFQEDTEYLNKIFKKIGIGS